MPRRWCSRIASPWSIARRNSALPQGREKKIPHAFLEGDLVHFEGRVRDAVSPAARRLVDAFPRLSTAETLWIQAQGQAQRLNYNPRFASCFYVDAPERSAITDRFIAARQLVIRGWACQALGPLETTPLLACDRMQPQALEQASAFELRAVRKGWEKTQDIQGDPTKARVRRRMS